MFIENILGTESKIKILRSLLEINTGFTIEELEKETGLSRGIIHRELRRLEKSKIIQQVEKKGKLGYYKIDLNNQYSQLLAKLFEIEKLQERKNKIPLITWNVLASITSKIITNKFKIDKMMVYGSIARGTSTIHSDIDLFIIVEDDFKEAKELNELIDEEEKKINREINVISMAKSKFSKDKTDLIREVKREGILLYGREELFILEKSKLGEAVLS